MALQARGAEGTLDRDDGLPEDRLDLRSGTLEPLPRLELTRPLPHRRPMLRTLTSFLPSPVEIPLLRERETYSTGVSVSRNDDAYRWAVLKSCVAEFPKRAFKCAWNRTGLPKSPSLTFRVGMLFFSL